MVNVPALTKMVMIVAILGYLWVRLVSDVALLSTFIVNRYWLNRRMVLTAKIAATAKMITRRILKIGFMSVKISSSFIF